MNIFIPPSVPYQVWILTPHFVTVVNTKMGVSATVPYVCFCTELHKRGFFTVPTQEQRP